MKKIINQSIAFTIASFIIMPVNYLAFFNTWKEAFELSFSISIAYFIGNILYEYVTIKNIKTLFKRLWFWLKYKRVKEIKMKSCYGCIFDDTGCRYSAFKCWNSNTIVRTRYYNPLNWLKKLFAFIIIAITISSCVTINVYKYEPTKTTPADTNKIESYWF